MPDTATLTARLEEAEAARHRLMTGAQEASVEYAGFKTSFSATDLARLDAYIAGLRRDLGIEAPVSQRRRARRVLF